MVPFAASVGDKGRTRSYAGGTERIDQLKLAVHEEELTGLAESFLRDFPLGQFPYLMEQFDSTSPTGPQGKATTSSRST
jgi:hypothetical protein